MSLPDHKINNKCLFERLYSNDDGSYSLTSAITGKSRKSRKIKNTYCVICQLFIVRIKMHGLQMKYLMNGLERVSFQK